jgi:hypothetical protein
MSSETTFRRYMAKGLKPYGHCIQVENSMSDGQPDTNVCIEGHVCDIELKYIRQWPKRESTIIKIPHYTENQRLWIFKRAMALGSVFLFVKVVNDYYLFTPYAAIEMVGKTLTRKGFRNEAHAYWAGRINFEELKGELKKWQSFRHAEKDLLKKYNSKAIQFT